MKNTIFCSLLVYLAYSLNDSLPSSPKTYRVNLQDPALVRWRPIILHYQQPLNKFMFHFNLPQFSQSYLKEIQNFARTSFKHQDLINQLDAISQISGHPMNKLLLMTYLLQFSDINGCTQYFFISRQENTYGYHRYSHMWQLLSNLIVNIQYHRNNQPIYSAITYVGTVQVLIMNKIGAYSVQVSTKSYANFQNNLINILHQNLMPTGWLIRKIADEQETYTQAVQRTQLERVFGPAFFIIISNTNEQGLFIQMNNGEVSMQFPLTFNLTNIDMTQSCKQIQIQNQQRKGRNRNAREQSLLYSFMKQLPIENSETVLTYTTIRKFRQQSNTTVSHGYNYTIYEVSSNSSFP